MKSAIKVLEMLGTFKKTVAVFGGMPRLGAAGKMEYSKVGVEAAAAGIDYIITIGEDAREIGLTAIKQGVDKSRVFFCMSADELYRTLLPLTGRNSLILFKIPYKYRLSKDPSYVKFIDKIYLK